MHNICSGSIGIKKVGRGTSLKRLHHMLKAEHIHLPRVIYKAMLDLRDYIHNNALKIKKGP